ncbi:MAG: pyruvate kinase [Clostridium sp.]|nr:pyruvate kinase [Clostridium sp.]
MRKTKIVCTIGPACESEEVLTAMCLAGMNTARLNFSHGTHEEQQKKVDLVKRVREKLGLPIAILLDTKGPEYRIGTFAQGKVLLREGDRFSFTTEQIVGDEHRVSVSYAGLVNDLAAGDTILLNNGLLTLRVEELTETDAVCRVLVGGETSNNKSMSFPNKVLKQAYLSERDKEDLLFGIRNDVDYIACSFVSCREDLETIHDFLRQHGRDDIPLIAKIENQAGIDNVEEICQACEGIMIGRGDLGVEVPFQRLPAIQKQLIKKCRLLGKRVITATEMLESMIHNIRPTRAEISDVANAVYDGTSAIMLSGETAVGKYPVETVATMSRIAEETEGTIRYDRLFYDRKFPIQNKVDAVSHAACGVAIDIEADAIAVSSLTGATVRMISRFQPPTPVLGITSDRRTWQRLALNWGVTPVMCTQPATTDEMIRTAQTLAQETLALEQGSTIVITGGEINGTPGNTDLIKVKTI